MSEPTSRRSTGRTWAGRLALASVSFLTPLLVLEVWHRVRSEEPRYVSNINMVFDPDLGFRQQPGYESSNLDEFGKYPYRLSSLGFRGPELPPPGSEKPEGVARIAFFGDSFLQGYVVRPERLMGTVTRELIEEAGREVEVYSLGSSDFGTAQELLLLREYGKQIRPDAVVLQMFTGNDVLNNGLELARLDGAGSDYIRPYLVPDGDGGLEVTYTHPVRALFRRWSLAFRIYELKALRLGAKHDVDWLKMALPRRTVGERIAQELTPLRFQEVYREPPSGSPWDRAWESTARILAAFRAEADRLGARFLVLVVPTQEQVQVDAKVLGDDIVSRAYGGPPLDTICDWNYPESRLSEIFERERIEARLLLDPLRAAAELDEPLYALDKHLTWRGHAIAARAVADWFLAGDSSDTFTPARLESSAPTRVFPEDPSKAPRWVDFRSTDGNAFLWDGWDLARSRAPWIGVDTPGRFTKAHASIVLPNLPDELVVRGCVPEAATLPMHARFSVSGGPVLEYVFTESGTFEFRMPGAVIPELRHSELDPYVRLVISVDPTFDLGGRTSLGLFVQEVGFADESRSDGRPQGDRRISHVFEPPSPATLAGDVASLSLSRGGAQVLTLDAGKARAGCAYVVLGSATGTRPGVAFSRFVVLPLNPDRYFGLTLRRPGAKAFGDFRGTLDESGRATATFTLPPVDDPSLVGVTLHHAYLTSRVPGHADLASNAVPVTLVE